MKFIGKRHINRLAASCWLTLVLLIANMGNQAFARAYYVDSISGRDDNKGTNSHAPWKTLGRANQVVLEPGDSLCFSRGSSYSGKLLLLNSGLPGRPIVVTAYGPLTGPAPVFSNPEFANDQFGNCIRVEGSYIIVEKLLMEHTAAYTPVTYNGSGWPVWEMGAIHIGRQARYCIVRDNEIRDCVAGIRSNGEHCLIEHNWIHDCNRVLKEWNWGPIGIWLGADFQEVRYNRIFNYKAVDPRITWGPDAYGGGADGGAMEIDDARYNKEHIAIHHNYTRDCQGFLEVTWTDVKQRPVYRNFEIHHNVSDDYQQFIALWQGADCRIENNSIIRRKVNANDWGVFNITQTNGHNLIRNNIVVVENEVVIFNLGKKKRAQPGNIISHNLYYAAGGSLQMGLEGPGANPVFANPLFRRYHDAQDASDFSLTSRSPAINRGMPLNYHYDFDSTPVPQYSAPDIGAFEFAGKLPPPSGKLLLASNRQAKYIISVPGPVTETERFAATELARYLEQISEAKFSIQYSSAGNKPNISLVRDAHLKPEEYKIRVKANAIQISGGSARAVLFAVYAFLEKLGCHWYAPSFAFYNGQSEYIPSALKLEVEEGMLWRSKPDIMIRKLDVEEGRSHDIESLKAMVNWMPKVGLNTLMVPTNYRGGGRVKWDNWREALTPELQKRGLIIEAGGHGYQNFLNAGMENGTLFKEHPDWFGQNDSGQPDPRVNLVFNTSNPQAVHYLGNNIVSYLAKRPEIDIFDCWPPDVARWAESPAFKKFGDPADRQAGLVNQIDSVIRKQRPGIRLEVIAYGQVLAPPANISLNPDILVDICPINQSFEAPLFDDSRETNRAYAEVFRQWRKIFPGDLGAYTYYRKYAWNSLPVVFPHYIMRDLQWYVSLPLQAISTYAEPGDWYTYELNHYLFAKLAWNSRINIDSMMNEYYQDRYGDAAQAAAGIHQALEQIVPNMSSIPYTSLKPLSDLQTAIARLGHCREELAKSLSGLTNAVYRANGNRLLNMADYALADLRILGAIRQNKSAPEWQPLLDSLLTLLHGHAHEGLFTITGSDFNGHIMHHYQSISNRR